MYPIVEKPRINEFIIDKPKNPFANKEVDINTVKMEKISIDDQYKKDIESGKGFLITNEDPLDRKNNKTVDGLFSPLYGIDSFNDSNDDSLYRCECGELNGAINEGEICDKCGTPCMKTESDLTISGYISLGKYYVINPACYLDIQSLIGKNELLSILKFSSKFNIKGKNLSIKTKANPYAGIGMVAFHNNFDEIIKYYSVKRKNKKDYYDNIIKFRNAIFTHYVNPYSALLRPYIMSGGKVCLFKINKLYGSMLANANIINNENIGNKDTIVEANLFEIQSSYNEVFDYIIRTELSGKHGLFRDKIITARIDNSARMVIVPGHGLKANEIAMPYAVALELLRGPLIYELSKIDYIDVRTANSLIDEAQRKFSKRLWILMNWILSKSDNPPKLMLQRSPCLLLESIRLMKIKYVKSDFYDLTLSVPVAILNGLNADFDGDVFSSWMIYDKRLMKAWEVHNAENHFISRYTGEYSDLAGFIKDSAVILTELWEIGKNEAYYKEWANDEDYKAYMFKKMNDDDFI